MVGTLLPNVCMPLLSDTGGGTVCMLMFNPMYGIALSASWSQEERRLVDPLFTPYQYNDHSRS